MLALSGARLNISDKKQIRPCLWSGSLMEGFSVLMEVLSLMEEVDVSDFYAGG